METLNPHCHSIYHSILPPGILFTDMVELSEEWYMKHLKVCTSIEFRKVQRKGFRDIPEGKHLYNVWFIVPIHCNKIVGKFQVSDDELLKLWMNIIAYKSYVSVGPISK
jgi:hypothetical protein